MGTEEIKRDISPKKRCSVMSIALLLSFIMVATILGGVFGAALTNYYWQEKIGEIFEQQQADIKESYSAQTTQEEKIIRIVEEYSPAVVSIVITKEVPVVERYFIDPFDDPFGWGLGWEIPQYRQRGTEKRQVGAGTGFVVSQDGTILTNKHVVAEEGAEYTIFLNDGDRFPAEILAKDPLYDLAILKIDQSHAPEDQRRDFPTVSMGDSSKLKIGQTVIAIGNALGEFQNTVSAGVISGLRRNIVASAGAGYVETLEGVIQTDAAINPGNSGGPLLNLSGEVIGVNVARSVDGENIGFSLPVNMAKRAVEQFREQGEIVYPFLGIYYTMINQEMSRAYDLPVDYGAWVGRNSSGQKTIEAIFAGSPAEKAGLRPDDIILEFDGEKLTSQNPLARVIVQYQPQDEVTLKILREGEEIIKQVILSKR